MKGFYNRLLFIDASARSFEVRQLSDDLLRQTMGCKGLATRLLLEHNPKGVDPLGPDNHLIFATGPVTGSSVWGSCRYGVFTKSPQTGLYSEAYSGGSAAEPMAATGFDAVMIKGKADGKVWIEVNEDGAVFHDASGLWGKETYQTEDEVKALVKESREKARRVAALVIGPAGENLVTFAVIENEYWRSAGRTGVGAVMGSKNIKAMAFWGSAKKEPGDAAVAKQFAKDMAAKGKSDAGVKAYKSMGTPMMVDIMSGVNSFPSKYWHQGTVEHRETINATALHERCEVKQNACLKCFIACGRLATVKGGRHAGLKIEGPEYETIFSFGGLCMIEGIEEVAHLNDICDRLGLDTISGGNLVAMAMDAKERKIIDQGPDYGDVDGAAQLLHDIAYRRGLGGILARGIKEASVELGMAEDAIHVKGLEPAGYDPRVLKGMGLAYGTSDRGACHMRSTFYKPELAGMVEIDQIKGKAEVFIDWEDRLTFFDTMVLCRFYRDLYQWEELQTMTQGLTGLNLSIDDLKAIAKSVADDTRRFNLREGLTPEGDKLPRRFYEEALPETGGVISREEMDLMLKEYYAGRGWDQEGRPPA